MGCTCSKYKNEIIDENDFLYEENDLTGKEKDKQEENNVKKTELVQEEEQWYSVDEELGEINNGSDYEYTYNNQYDLYIPYTATQRKEKYNRVILDIHGGAWVGGEKYQMNMFFTHI